MHSNTDSTLQQKIIIKHHYHWKGGCTCNHLILWDGSTWTLLWLLQQVTRKLFLLGKCTRQVETNEIQQEHTASKSLHAGSSNTKLPASDYWLHICHGSSGCNHYQKKKCATYIMGAACSCTSLVVFYVPYKFRTNWCTY